MTIKKVQLSKENAAKFGINHIIGTIEKLRNATQENDIKQIQRLADDIISETHHIKWIYSKDNTLYNK